jgi:hypothetical protein
VGTSAVTATRCYSALPMVWRWLFACTDRGEDPPPPAEVSCACIPAPESSGIRHGWASLAVGEDAAAWILYAQSEGPQVTGLFLARSPRPGAPLEPVGSVPIPTEPNVGTTEKPSLALHGDQLAIAFSGSAPHRHGDAEALWLLRATLQPDGALLWEEPVVLDELVGQEFVVEHARVTFTHEGELWALWKRQRYGELDLAFWAREQDGWTPTRVSEELSTEHDCSPPDFHTGRSGDLLLALRSNVGGWLDTFVVRADPDDHDSVLPLQVSHDDWRYQADVCPEDGPRLVELSDGRLHAAWLAPNDFAWALRSAWWDGTRWGEPVQDHAEIGLGERWVALVADDRGGVYTAVEDLTGDTRILYRDQPGEPQSDRRLLGGEEQQLIEVELAHGGGRTVALGKGEDLWLVEIQP